MRMRGGEKLLVTRPETHHQSVITSRLHFRNRGLRFAMKARGLDIGLAGSSRRHALAQAVSRSPDIQKIVDHALAAMSESGALPAMVLVGRNEGLRDRPA